VSTFNKAHYKIIAQAIKDARSEMEVSVIPTKKIINLLSFYFNLDNPRFNEDAFRKACGDEQHHE